VSIIRVGLAETKKFAEGYDAIFGKSKKIETAGTPPKASKKSAKSKKKAKRK